MCRTGRPQFSGLDGGGFDGDAPTQRTYDFHDRAERWVATWAEALVQAFTVDSGVFGDLCHAACFGDVLLDEARKEHQW